MVAASLVVLLAGDRLCGGSVEVLLRFGQARSFVGNNRAKRGEVISACDRSQARGDQGRVEQGTGLVAVSRLSTCLAGKAFQLADAVAAGLGPLLDERFPLLGQAFAAVP